MQLRIENSKVGFGERFSLSFQRTLRIPDDGKEYPLPPGLGAFPVFNVEDFAEQVPANWREEGGVFIPMYQKEALWLFFKAAEWKPNAVKLGVGGVNAVTGRPFDEELRDDPQDYLVCPPQPWLDGIKSGPNTIRQFVAMPLGRGYTVEGAVTGREDRGGLEIVVYEPKPGLFPDQPPEKLDIADSIACAAAPMGLGAGGKMRQKLYPDPHGIDTWDMENRGRLRVHILNSLAFKEVTGREPPPSPIDAKTYTKYGFPWFDLYDESLGDLETAETLSKAKTVAEREKELGESPEDDEEITVSDWQIKKLKPTNETTPARKD